jgi:hypothetical protein
LKSRKEILEKVYSKEVKVREKIIQHRQYQPIEGAAAQLEVLLDIRYLLEQINAHTLRVPR